MNLEILTADVLERRAHWVSEIVKISGTFGEDTERVEQELTDEVRSAGSGAILDHLRLCGAIPESYGHDTSEEKLYSKYTDVLLAVAFRSLGLTAGVFTQRADAADVEAVGPDLSFVADAKAFRLSRTAKNQKDFKVQAMDGWKQGKPYAMVVAPLYQLPTRESQIYQQAIALDVCVISYDHLSLLVAFADAVSPRAAQEILLTTFQSLSRLNPTKDSVAYWRTINDSLLSAGSEMNELWQIEKKVAVESIAAAKEEGLRYLAAERERIMRLTQEQAIQQLLDSSKLQARIGQIEKVEDKGLFALVTK